MRDDSILNSGGEAMFLASVIKAHQKIMGTGDDVYLRVVISLPEQPEQACKLMLRCCRAAHESVPLPNEVWGGNTIYRQRPEIRIIATTGLQIPTRIELIDFIAPAKELKKMLGEGEWKENLCGQNLFRRLYWVREVKYDGTGRPLKDQD